MIKELMEKRGLLQAEIDTLHLTLESEKRGFSDSERTRFAEIETEMSKIDSDIADAKRLQEMRTKKVELPNYGASDNHKEKDTHQMGKVSLLKIARSLKDKTALDGLEAEIAQEGQKELRSRGLGIKSGELYLPEMAVNGIMQFRTMDVTNSTKGGNTVPTEKLGWFDALYAELILPKLGVKKFTDLTSNVDLIGLTTGATAGWDTEIATITGTDAATGARELRPNRAYSAMDVSKLLNIQSNVSIEAELISSMFKSLGVLLETAVINGDGTNKPLGILGTSGIQNVAMGANGGAPTLAKILDLVEAVLSANTTNPNNLKFAINPKVEKKLKQTVIDSGSGAMIMAYNQYFGGTQGIIDNREAVVGTLIPSNLTKGSSSGVCSAILFGDFSQVVIAQYGGISLSLDKDSVGAARNNTDYLTINMFVDSVVRQPACVGAILDVTTA